jgi:flavorubredoxin
MGAIDWDRRLFDNLIPLPDGTSYNSYLIKGSEKTVLIDSVDPSMADGLICNLEAIKRVDYVVSQHAEQDHSGAIPRILEKYREARVLASPQAKAMLANLLALPEERITAVKDGETVSLGDKTLEFIHTPWVHWPETMSVYLREERILFSGDFFGSHLATADLYAKDEARVLEAAKRYYAEIMMPFRKIIQKNLEKLAPFRIERIAPSHGPLYDRPELIIQAYQEWISDRPRNLAVIPFVSMHGSTEMMVRHLVSALIEKGVDVCQFSLPQTDIGKLAISLVDAATVVLGAPTVHVGAHPAALYAAGLVNMLRPKARFATVIGSYGWSSKAVEQITGAIPNLRAEVLNPVLCKGLPREADFKALDELALTILKKHQEIGIV